jgi:tyrosinase
MRDPVFYRWHAFVDSVFQAHKARLPPYTEPQLTFPGIVVNNIQIGTDGQKPNVVNTHWQTTDLNLTKGDS